MFRGTHQAMAMRLLKATLLPAILLGTFCLSARQSLADVIDGDNYAVVAYSQSTGKYGYAWNQPSYDAACRVAMSHCKADDAKVVGWVQNGWLALAIGQDNAYGVGWQYGDGAANTDAVDRAVDECHTRGQKVKKLVILCSGDIDPVIRD